MELFNIHIHYCGCDRDVIHVLLYTFENFNRYAVYIARALCSDALVTNNYIIIIIYYYTLNSGMNSSDHIYM